MAVTPAAPQHRNRTLCSPWIPVLTLVLFVVLGGLFWQHLEKRELQHAEQLLAREGKVAVDTLGRELRDQIQALQRMAHRRAQNPDLTEDRWRADARLYLQHMQNYQALEWVDNRFFIRWIEPPIGNESAQDFNVAFNPTRQRALERAARTGEVDFSGVIQLQQGGLGMVVYCPIGKGAAFNGFIAAVFRLDTLFSSLLSVESRAGFRWNLREHGDIRFDLQPKDALASQLRYQQPIDVFGLGWTLEAIPTQAWLADKRGGQGVIAFTIWSVTGILLAVLVHLGQTMLRRQEDLLAARLALREEQNQRKVMESHLERLSSNDPLTGLVNRRFFMEDLHQNLILAERKSQQLALIVLDLDGFQTLNDTLGHELGDELLVRVAQRLDSLSSESVTVGHSSADEYLICQQHVADVDSLIELLGDVMRSFEKPFDIQGQRHHITGTMGVAVYPESGQDASTLLRNADTALSRAKETSRGSYQFYTVGMHERARQRLELDKSLRQAIQNDEFVLFLQPQLDLATGQVGSAEALIRWMHPERGLLPPFEFIPAAVESGLITEIGRWVIRAACRQLGAWNGTPLSHIRIAVNLSGKELDSPDLVDYVESALDEKGIDPSRLELELTEEIFVANIERNLDHLTRLSRLGVHLAIDDFGVGYSSLSYLKNFPVNLLKIDRSFIQNVIERHDDAVITRAVINLSHNLGIQVAAEGIETEAQLNFLRAHNCDLVQGYLIGKPMPVMDLEHRLLSSLHSWQH